MKPSLCSIYFIAILTGLFGQAAFAQVTKKYQGLLWEISKPGEPKKSYLYGTMHVSKKISFNLSDTFYLALENADIVGLESAPSEWLDNVENSAYLNYYFGSYPTFTYQQDFYQRCFQFVPPDNRKIGSELSDKNSMVNHIQYRNSSQTDFEEETYLDMFIFKTALKLNKPVASLEDFHISEDLYYKANMKLNEDRIERNNRKTPKWLEDIMKGKSYYSLIEDSYREGNLDMIDVLHTQYSSSRYNRLFLFKRNEYMAESIDSIIKRGNSLFSGIGAAHLPGDEGVIEMLRRKGYNVRSVSHTQTEISKEKKQFFEDKIKPISPIWQISPDGTFKIKLPGKLYTLYAKDDSKQYYSADYANGGYFFINKINVHNFISHLSPKDYELKVDSLLYENIPGKILEKKKIIRNGIKGIEVKNITSTGDAQRYQIYFTPLEIIILKYGGKKNYIHQWEDTIFNSLEFLNYQYQTATPKQYYNNEFSILMPSYCIFNYNDTLEAIYKQPEIYGYDAKMDAYYFFKKSILNDLYSFEEDQFELEHIAEKFCKRHYYELKTKKLIQVQGYPAIEFTGVNGKYIISGRLVIRAGKYYFFGTSSQNKSDISKFLNSFKMNIPNITYSFNTYSDTCFLFSVTTDTSVNFTNKYFDGVEIYNDFNQKNENDYSESDEEYYTVFQSLNKDIIKVSYKRFTSYDYFENEDSFYNNKLKTSSVFKNAIIANKIKSETNGNKSIQVQIRDTNTIRNIHVKIILNKNNDAMYMLTTMNDTISPLPEFTQKFFTSFMPKDTVTGVSIFENKSEIILNDIISSDTTKNKRARASLRKIKFGKKDASNLIAFLNTYKFKDGEDFFKYDICKKIIGLKGDTILEYAENLYKTNENNFPIQSVALSIIASQENIKSTKILNKIVTENQPFLEQNSNYNYYDDEDDEDDYTINSGALSYIEDSLALLKINFPEFLSLKDNKDYAKNVVFWLSRLLDSNQIDTGIYSKDLDYFYNELNTVLRKEYSQRQFKLMNEKRDNERSYYRYSSNSYPNFYLQNLLTIVLPFNANPKIGELLKQCDFYLNDADLISFYRKKFKYTNQYNQSRIDSIAANPETLVSLYNGMKKINKLNIIPSEYLKESNLIIAGIKGKGSYSTRNLDFKKNPPELLKKEIIKAKNKDLEVYYYLYDKSKDENTNPYYGKKNSYILITVVYEMGTKDINKLNPYQVTTVELQDKDRLEDEYIETKNFYQLMGRKRATKIDLPLINNSYDDYYDDY